MSRISVLVFAPEDDDDITLTPDRASPDTTTTTIPNDIAFLVESHRRRFINIHKPYSLLFTRTTSPTGGATYNPFLNPPLLKVHIATVRDVSSSLLPSRLSRTLGPVATNTPTQTPEDWLDASLAALQKANLVQRFSVPKFHRFLVDTLHQQQPQHGMGRRVSCGTTELDYLALLSSNSEVKKMLSPDPDPEEGGKEGDGDGGGSSRTWSFCGFRISSGGRSGEKSRKRSVNEWERSDDPYGGLM